MSDACSGRGAGTARQSVRVAPSVRGRARGRRARRDGRPAARGNRASPVRRHRHSRVHSVRPALVLWVGFLGAALGRARGHDAGARDRHVPSAGRARDWADTFAATVAAAVSTMLCVGAFELVMSEREAGTVIAAGVTTWMAQTVLPFAFGLIALRTVWRAKGGWPVRARSRRAAWSLADGWCGMRPRLVRGGPSVAARSRRFSSRPAADSDLRVLGGSAIVLFLTDGVGAVGDPHRDLLAGVKPTLAAIPLFTLARVSARRGQGVGAAAARVPRAGSAGSRAARRSSARCSARSSRSSRADPA